MKGVVQEDYGSGLDPLPGIWEYLGTDIRKVYPVVHLPREIEPVFREMHVWKRLEEDLEKKSVYLFTDTSDRIVLGRGLEGTDWWHQPIIDSTDQGLKDYILENNVQMCWKYAPVSRPIPRMEDRQGELLIFLFEFSSNMYLDVSLIRDRPTATASLFSSTCW